MRFHINYFEEAGIFQANNLLIDLKTQKELSLTEAAFRISKDYSVRESKISSFNDYNVVKAFKENNIISRLEYAFKLGLTTKYAHMPVHEGLDFDMITDYMGYGQLNESAMTEELIVERLRNLNDPLILEGFFSKIGNAIKKGVSAVGNVVKKGAQAVGNGIVKGAQAVGKFAKGVVDTLGDWAKKLGAFATKVWEAIKKVASFAGQLLIKFFDAMPGIVDFIKPVFKIIPTLSSVFSIGGGISCILKSLQVKTVNESRLNEDTVSPELAAKREKTGFVTQAVVMFGTAVLKAPPDSALVNGLKTGVQLALADGKGKIMSILPYITKNVKVEGIAGQITEIFTNPAAIISGIISKIISGINFVAGKIWSALGGEKLLTNILKPAISKLVDKFKEMMGGGKKDENEEGSQDASTDSSSATDGSTTNAPSGSSNSGSSSDSSGGGSSGGGGSGGGNKF